MIKIADKIMGLKLGSAGVMEMTSDNIGLNINNDLISRLLAAGALKAVLKENDAVGRGFQAYSFSMLDVKTVYTVLFIENSLVEMGRNTRTPFKNQYYALGRYFYELYAENNDVFAMESFVDMLPDDIIAEGLAKGIIEEPEGTRSYNGKLAACVVVTFFYYMTMICAHGSYDINELTQGLKKVITVKKAATLLNYSPARVGAAYFYVSDDESFDMMVRNSDYCIGDIQKLKAEINEDLDKEGYLKSLQGWCELVIRADTTTAYLSRIALSSLRAKAGRDNVIISVEEGNAFLSWLTAITNA